MKDTQEQKDGFRLIRTGNFYTVVQITKGESVTIVHNARVPQSLLKKVYDAGPQYRKLIEAPTGYKAPWQ